MGWGGAVWCGVGWGGGLRTRVICVGGRDV